MHNKVNFGPDDRKKLLEQFKDSKNVTKYVQVEFSKYVNKFKTHV